MSKEKIFALLSAQAGDFVSGEDISAQLGISRAAVWKAVSALRRDGYTIEAQTGLGYRLADSPDVLSEREDEPGAPLVAVRVLDQPTRGKVDENERDQHEKSARTRAEPIEEQAPQCEHSVAEAGGDNIVYRQKGGQKIKEKR